MYIRIVGIVFLPMEKGINLYTYVKHVPFSGNPVSAYVCALLFVIRAMRVACGVRGSWARLRVRLAHAAQLDARPEYARASLELHADRDMPYATMLGSQVCTDSRDDLQPP